VVTFLKAVLRGVAVLSVAALAVAAYTVVLMLKHRATMSTAFGDGFYIVIHWHVWATLCVSLLIFAVGFCWQYRRTR
jgi:hypothetical protein